MGDDLVDRSVKAYQENQAAVNADLDAELSTNKMVLFMEGSPDAPKSETSHNVIKMLTQAQVMTFLSVDTMTHPAILGYTVSKSSRNRGPHLYKDGPFFADYDGILSKYKTGELAKELGSTSTRSTGVF